MSEFNAKNASKVVEEYVKEKIEPVVEENVRAARIRDLEKKLEIAVEALANLKQDWDRTVDTKMNWSDSDITAPMRGVSVWNAVQALLAIQGKQ